jgi:cytochrome c biogenesis protein
MAQNVAAGAGSLRDQARAKLGETWNEFVRLFSNVLFAVSLFAVWGVLTLIGVVVDQGKEPAFYTANYAPPLARLVLRLGLDNIYHGPAYVGIIGLILLSLGVCTFRRVIPARLPPLRPVAFEHIALNASLDVEGREDAIRARLESALRGLGWQIRRRELGGVEWTFADKHNWARRGVLVAHMGFVIIAAGTSLYWATGYSGQTAVLAGTTVTIPENGTRLSLDPDGFRYRIDPIVTKSGVVYQPIDYVSSVHVTGKDGVTRKATIRVNHPLDVDGTLYYQSTYGQAVAFALTKGGRAVAGGPAEPLKEGEGFVMPGTSRALQYTQFVGTIDRETGDPAPDPRPNNPGAIVTAFDGDEQIGRALIPLGGSIDLGGGYRLGAPRYTLYSGIQYRYDPGIPLVGIGAFVLLAGLCISFYLLPARLYVRLDGGETSWRVRLAATTVKGYQIFEEQFAALIESLREPLREAPSHGS